MRLNGNEITIVRGESFSIDRTIVNRDGSPYIVSNELLNPNILITVADNSFLSKSSKVYKYFLSLNELPRFTLTNPVHLNETSPSGDVKEFPECTLDYSNKYLDREFMISTKETVNIGYFCSGTYEVYFDEEYVGRYYLDLNELLYFTIIRDDRNIRVSVLITENQYNYSAELQTDAFYDDDLSFESVELEGTLKLYSASGELVFITRYLPDGTIVKMSPEDALFTNNEDYKYWLPNRLEAHSNGKWLDYKFRFVKTFASTVTAEWEPKTYYYSIELVSGLNPQEGQYDDVTVILPPSKLNVLSNLRGGLK